MPLTHEVIVNVGPINWKLLRRQKTSLVSLATLGKTVTGEDCEAIDGILNLIDAIQDRAVDGEQATEREVFGR
jgi:hypothetical protein